MRIKINKNHPLIILFLSTYFISENSFSHEPSKTIHKEHSINIIIYKNKFHEECFSLHKNQYLSYVFNSSEPVEFNIHYHVKGNIFFPVFPEFTNAGKHDLKILHKNDYCLMWTNKNQPSVQLNYKIRVGSEPVHKTNENH